MTPQQQQAIMALARTRMAPQAQGPTLGQGGQMRPMFARGGSDDTYGMWSQPARIPPGFSSPSINPGMWNLPEEVDPRTLPGLGYDPGFTQSTPQHFQRPQKAFGGGDLHGKLHQRPISHTVQMFGHNLNPLSAGMHRLGMTNPYSSRPHFAPGGMPDPRIAALARMRAPLPQVPKRAPNGDPIHTGPIRSPVAGRTDHLAMSVPSGAYVIPADVVNHLGQDNSEAGHGLLEQLFHSDAIRKLHERPGVKPFGQHLPIAAAGGEYVVAPEAVAHRGGGSIHTGHRVLDKFVLDKRHEHIKELKHMPGPQR